MSINITMEPTRIIAVSGVIGAGKTTFMETMSKGLNIPAFYEHVEGNSLIPLMYKDPKRWAFTLQMNFLREKFVQMKQAYEIGICLVERTIFEDIIFTQAHREQGNICDEEWMVYNEMYKHFCQYAPHPDLMIFLDVPDDLALERIRLRGRPYEQGDDKIPYYLRMNDIYRKWVEEYEGPKIVVDNAGFDYINNPSHRDQMIQYLKRFIEDGEY